jgi:hypothetical protein
VTIQDRLQDFSKTAVRRKVQDRSRDREPALTRGFAWWAILGLNQ